MRRNRLCPPGTLFHGNEWLRLATMIVMLGVIFLMIERSRDPNTWTWLAADTPTGDVQNSPPAEKNGLDDNNDTNKPNSTKSPHPNPLPKGEGTSSIDSMSETTKPASDLGLGGPSDQDPQEAEAVKEEFQAVSDGTLSIQREEMAAYHRLLKWTENQPLAEMLKRAKKDSVLTQFYQSPDKYRGQLFTLELNVRRILKYSDNGIALYEVWGWTSESRTWLYVGVVIDLPKGMPIGPDVYENATLVGYFFKMQGYLEAGAKPHAAPLQAPLFVGRLIWRPTEKPQAQHADGFWGLFLLIAFLAFITFRWGLLLWDRIRRSPAVPAGPAKSNSKAVEDWLANTQSDNLTEEDKPQEDADSQHGGS
jgi:hypothetical protein